MANLIDRFLSHGPERKALTAEQAARSVVVLNIPQQTTAENIVIHFQRQKNGGGEIDHVHIPEKGTAVVTFESSEVAKNVLKHCHKLEGSELKLQRFIPREPPEVFQQVKARVDLSKLHLPPLEAKNILDTLKENTQVAHSKGSKNLILSGTFSQIEAAHKLLQFLISAKGGKGSVYYGGNITKTQGNSSRGLDELSSVTANITEASSFEVQPQFMKLLKRVRKTNLQDIEENFGVVIIWNDNASQVRINPGKMSNGQNRFQEGCDAFIDLYQKFHPNIGREVVELPDEANGALVFEAVSFVQSKTPVIVEKVENNLVVYAEKAVISSSVHTLKEKLGLTKDGSSRKTRRGHGNKNRDAHEDDDTQQDGRFKLPKQLNQVLNNGVNISLHQGDITDERVDAIVNAANEWLQHGAGVAGAIVSKGGYEIQDESNWITNRQGPLNVGEAVYTSGGILPCRYVIHTVGPRWREHGRQKSISLLHQACMKSLRLAAQLELSSIALTAISSGIFGMPKDICAQVMFEAVEEFSSSKEAEFSTLRDVRIVIIDEPTMSIFHEEFVKRYRSKEWLQETVTHQLQETSVKTNEKKDLSQSNRDDSLAPEQNNDNHASHGKPKQHRRNDALSNDARRDKENSDHSDVPDDIKKVKLSNQATENAKEANPPTDIERPKLQGNETKGALKDNDSASVDISYKVNKSTAPKTMPGRGRSNLAATFQKSPGEVKSTPTESNPLQGKSANAGRGLTPKTAINTTSPPGRTVTEEGKTFATQFGDRVNNDQRTDVAKSVGKKNEAERVESRGTSFQEESQAKEPESKQQNIDGENSNKESPKMSPTDHKTASQSQFTQDHSSVNKLPPKETVTDVVKTMREPAERSGNDDEGVKHPNVEHTENVKSTADQSREDQTNKEDKKTPESLTEGASNEGAPSQDLLASETTKGEIQTMTEGSAKNESPVRSPHSNSSDNLDSSQSVNKSAQDKVGARQDVKDTKGNPSGGSDSGPSPPNETHKSRQTSEPICSMCMNLNNDQVYPSQCGRDHFFCTTCIKAFIEKTGICPQCQAENLSQGNQPTGMMTWITATQGSLPGYEDCGIIIVYFKLHGGIQGPEHPSPGQHYSPFYMTAFLPCNKDGQQICNLLQRAFDARLVFTIGKSPDTGEENSIVWNGIELKTNQAGGPANYGYPDPSYLDRVRGQLADKGIK